MNPHYHPYSELSSPHPSSPDNNNYPQMQGHGHHNGHGPIMGQMDGQQGFHHQINNNNNGPTKYCAGCSGKLNVRIHFLLFCCLPQKIQIRNLHVSSTR